MNHQNMYAQLKQDEKMSVKHRKKTEELEKKVMQNSNYPTTQRDQKSFERLKKFREGVRRYADKLVKQASSNDEVGNKNDDFNNN